METLQQSREQGLTSQEFHKLFDEIDEDILNLRSDEEYFDKYDLLAPKTKLGRDELEALITKNLAAKYAATNGFDETKTAAFMLFTAAPNYAINQARKNIYGADEKNLAVVSDFNDSARNFVTLHPEMDVDKLSTRLVESISRTDIDNEFANDTELREAMDKTIAGVRSEAGSEQLFTYAQIPFVRATQAEDLEHVDYLIPRPRKVLKLDVKSSATGTGTDNSVYARIGENHYRLLRLFGNSDFKGNSFQLREQSLEAKAEGTRTLIDHLAEIG